VGIGAVGSYEYIAMMATISVKKLWVIFFPITNELEKLFADMFLIAKFLLTSSF